MHLPRPVPGAERDHVERRDAGEAEEARIKGVEEGAEEEGECVIEG
jgi:hypothetical protein